MPTDRIQFLHSVDTNGIDFSDAIFKYFDQLMGIYGLVQPCNYKITFVGSSDDSLELDMKLNDGESANKIANILTNLNGKIEIYQRVFFVSFTFVELSVLRMIIATEK